MPRRTALVATGVVATALLLGVVAVRGGTAAQEQDLLTAGPEVEATAPPDVEVLLEANGTEGARLGTEPAEGSDPGMEDASGACTLVFEPLLRAGVTTSSGPPHPWSTAVWVREDRVVSLLVSSVDGVASGDVGLRTWLGPTLGSPIQAAQELPGARSVLERPFGTDGPAVTVVTVAARGTEVVFGDAPVGLPQDRAAGDEAGGPGGITSIEVRYPRARSCDGSWSAEGPAVEVQADIGGVGQVRLGSDPAEVIEAGLLLDDGSASGGADPVCRWLAPGELPVSVQVVDGLVAAIFLPPTAGEGLGLPADADVSQVAAVFPELATQQDRVRREHQATVDLGPSLLQLQFFPEVRGVDDLEVPVFGEELRVSSLSLLAAGVDVPEFC